MMSGLHAQHCKQHQIQVVLVKWQHHANVQMRQVEANSEGFFTVYGKAVSRTSPDHKL